MPWNRPQVRARKDSRGSAARPSDRGSAGFGKRINYTFSVGYSVGHDDLEKFRQVEVFPNPATGIVYLDLAGVEGQLDLVVTNALGQVVDQQKWNQTGASMNPVDLSNLPDGWYHFTLSTQEGEVFTRKVVLSR